MTFASLEEAWGVPAFGDAARPGPFAGEGPPTQTQTKPVQAFDPGETRGRTTAASVQDDEVVVTRGVLQRAYRDRGTAGVLSLLPAECQESMLQLQRSPGRGEMRGPGPRGGPRGGRRRRRRPSWAKRMGKSISRALSDPNVLLLIVVALFAVLVMWDSKPAADTFPSIASLHLSPFPLGGSATV